MSGKRHNEKDQKHLDQAAQHLMAAGALMPNEGDGENEPAAGKAFDDTLLSFGASVKALGAGRIGGYLVRFSGSADPDLTNDFFDTKTDLGSATQSDVYYNHGLDAKLGRRVIGTATFKRDDAGVWAEAQLALRDEYEKTVYALAEQGKLGWSSGTAAHLVEREQSGKAMHITRWPLGLDASLTPTPAEPRNSVIPLKSFIPVREPGTTASGEQPGQAEHPAAPDGATAGGSPAAASSATSIKEIDMTPEELKAMQDAQAANTKAIADLTAQNAELLAELRKPALKTAAAVQVEAVNEKPERPFKTIGEQLFAIRDKATGQANEQQVNKLAAVKALAVKATGANEATQSEGGDLVQTDFADYIFQRAYSTGQITSRCTKQPIGQPFNGVKIPAVDEQSRADGSRWGGIRGYWAAEAAAATKSKPVWRHVVLELKKLFAVVYGTDELLADSTAFSAYLNRVVPLELAFKLEDGILNGQGGGFPLGILNAPALVSITKETNQAAATIVYPNVLKMYARMWAGGQGPNIVPGGGSLSATVWLVNQDTYPALGQMSLPVGTGGSAVFLPPGGASGSPFGVLFGRPIIAVEQCATLGTVGDIVLVDLSQYVLAEKGGVQDATSIHVQFLTDETTFRWTFRTDGQPLWQTALTPFKGSNTQSAFIALATRS